MSGLEDTLELPVPRRFWKKWELWILGLSIVTVLSAATFSAVVGLHALSSKQGSLPDSAPFTSTAFTPTKRGT